MFHFQILAVGSLGKYGEGFFDAHRGKAHSLDVCLADFKSGCFPQEMHATKCKSKQAGADDIGGKRR